MHQIDLSLCVPVDYDVCPGMNQLEQRDAFVWNINSGVLGSQILSSQLQGACRNKQRWPLVIYTTDRKNLELELGRAGLRFFNQAKAQALGVQHANRIAFGTTRSMSKLSIVLGGPRKTISKGSRQFKPVFPTDEEETENRS